MCWTAEVAVDRISDRDYPRFNDAEENIWATYAPVYTAFMTALFHRNITKFYGF
jgi:hypothetical protein